MLGRQVYNVVTHLSGTVLEIIGTSDFVVATSIGIETWAVEETILGVAAWAAHDWLAAQAA